MFLRDSPKDLIYDPFFGSGTTGVIAEKLDRRWIGSERSKTYIENAAIRFQSASIPIEEIA